MSRYSFQNPSDIVQYDLALFVRAYEAEKPFLSLSQSKICFNRTPEQCQALFNQIASNMDFLDSCGYVDIHYDIISAGDADSLESLVQEMLEDRCFEL